MNSVSKDQLFTLSRTIKMMPRVTNVKRTPMVFTEKACSFNVTLQHPKNHVTFPSQKNIGFFLEAQDLRFREVR